ncbi:XRE family transcriptional regulator [Enterovibrio nigricans]|nr:XRE family transcriptional regulator [Enterovibrio nigricans]
MILNKKIKAIRLDEGLTQLEFSQLIDIPVISLQNYEREVRNPSSENLMKITEHPRFEKYAFWLVTGKTDYESGHICPAFSTQEKCGLDVPQDAKRA